MIVLFLCTGNSCRSIIAEATFNFLAPPEHKAISAGSKPTGRIHPRSLAVLADQGISTEGYHSKSWNEVEITPGIVITVCSNAAGEECPIYLSKAIRVNWGVDDPAIVVGTDREINESFIRAYQILRKRIEAFFNLPLGELENNPTKLKAELDKIGELL